MKKAVLVLLVAAVLLLAACSVKQPQEVPNANSQNPPAKSDDSQPGAQQVIEEEPAVAVQQPKMTQEVAELLSRHKDKVKSIKYDYKGPETANNFFQFFVKGSRIKYMPFFANFDRPESYDSVFIDKIGLTARSYCQHASCTVKGKKADLVYGDYYIKTVFDWIDVDEAVKLGEEVIDSRSTWKMETNKGIIWVDTFYGIPLKAESNGETYRFQQISVNSVQDSDVVPSS